MSAPLHVYLGSDHAGYDLKTWLQERLKSEFPSAKINDVGTHSTASCDYPEFARAVGTEVAKGGSFGILVCGSGIGMAIAANKVKGIRAAQVWNSTSARLCRQHNDANVICLGARLLGQEVAWDALRTFLKTEFEAGRHQKRVDLIHQMETP